MRKVRARNIVPFFPLIPIIPAAVLVGSLIASIRALVGVRRLERRMMTAANIGAS